VQDFPSELAGRLELALWNPAATAGDFDRFCTGAINSKVRAVCVPSGRIARAVDRLEESAVKSIALIGFPLGNSDPDVKRFETEAAIDNGAQEIELVLNTGRLKEGDSASLLRELRDIVESADERPVCATIETSALKSDEITLVCHLLLDSGVTAVASSTGFWPGIKSDAAMIKLLRESTSPRFEIKAAPTAQEQEARAFIEAGATRLGVVLNLAGR
jgi:deoxyribose-phosphate aldolase